MALGYKMVAAGIDIVIEELAQMNDVYHGLIENPAINKTNRRFCQGAIKQNDKQIANFLSIRNSFLQIGKTKP